MWDPGTCKSNTLGIRLHCRAQGLILLNHLWIIFFLLPNPTSIQALWVCLFPPLSSLFSLSLSHVSLVSSCDDSVLLPNAPMIFPTFLLFSPCNSSHPILQLNYFFLCLYSFIYLKSWVREWLSICSFTHQVAATTGFKPAPSQELRIPAGSSTCVAGPQAPPKIGTGAPASTLM